MSLSPKEQGNVDFAAGRYTEAVDLYSKALATAGDDPESLAAIYSNRCAAYVHLFECDRGLLDADKAVELRSDWDRAYARRAECYTQLGDFDLARQQYELAVQHAQDLAAKSRFSSAIAALRSREQSIQTARLMAVSIDFPARISALEAEGKTEFVEGGAAELVLTAYGWVDDAMQKIDRDVVGDDKTFQSKVPSGILTLTDAVLASPLSFHIPPGSNPSHPLGEKLPLQYQYDIQVFANQRYLLGSLSAEEIIDEFDTRVAEEGWTRMRTALAHLIRGQVLMAFVEEATGAYTSAVKKYRYALALVEEGISKWKAVSADKKGTTFMATFRRGVQAALMLALEEGWSNAKTNEDKIAFGLDEIQTHAEELLEDCASNPIPQDAANPTHWLSFQILPLVHAAKAIAFVLVHRSQQDTNLTRSGSATFFHPQMNAASAKMYSQAAIYLPLDDPDRPICLFLSLNCALRGGGLTIAEIFDRAAKAEAAVPVSEPVFGPFPRDFAGRSFVRQVCADLRKVCQAQDNPARFDNVVKPVPRVKKEDLSAGDSAQSLKEILGRGFWDELVGDVGVYEVV